MDRTSVSDTAFISSLAEFVEYNGIKLQHKTSSRGASIAGAVAVASYGARIASIGIPCRYAHSPVGYMNKADIESACDVCKSFIKESDVVINGFIKKTN